MMALMQLLQSPRQTDLTLSNAFYVHHLTLYFYVLLTRIGLKNAYQFSNLSLNVGIFIDGNFTDYYNVLALMSNDFYETSNIPFVLE